MDENVMTMSMIFHGCKLAKELESSLESKPENIEDLAGLCDQIMIVFGTARERLRGQIINSHNQDHHNSTITIDPSLSLHEWFVTQGVTDHVIQAAPMSTLGGSRAMDLLVSATANNCSSSSSQRPRKRRDNSDTRIVKMSAPQIGNIELPPDDGFTWRKYGQKEIMGKNYPRGYYRCTHQRQFKCPAKKQVQRDDFDSTTFEVTYRGSHTCHLSATAPSTLPPSQPVILSHHHDSWVSMESGAGPSRGLEFPVADFANAMFNSGSNTNSNNSMDFLFPSMEEHDNININKHYDIGRKKASD